MVARILLVLPALVLLAACVGDGSPPRSYYGDGYYDRSYSDRGYYGGGYYGGSRGAYSRAGNRHGEFGNSPVPNAQELQPPTR